MDNPGQEILVKRRSVTDKVGNVTCTHCKGTYRREKLAVHLTRCKQFVRVGEENKLSAIKEHSENNIASKGVSEEFQKEILHGIQKDNIIDAALNDPLILQFASDFHASRRESKSNQYVVREMRHLGRLLIKIKEIKPEINCFKDALNPAYFEQVVEAALSHAGYIRESGQIKVPSIAYRLLQPIKDCCNLAKKEELKEMYQHKRVDRSAIIMIDDFLFKIGSNWKKKIGRICRKSQKLGKVDKSANNCRRSGHY